MGKGLVCRVYEVEAAKSLSELFKYLFDLI